MSLKPSIPVDVPRVGHGGSPAKVQREPVGSVQRAHFHDSRPRRRPEHDVRDATHAGGELTHDDISEAVPVDIPTPGHGDAKMRAAKTPRLMVNPVVPLRAVSSSEAGQGAACPNTT